MFCSWQNKAGLNFVSLPSRCRWLAQTFTLMKLLWICNVRWAVSSPGQSKSLELLGKKVKRISKYVLDVLFKHTFHICPPIKYKTVQVVDFCFSHRNFTYSKGWPKSVHYIQGIWLIKVHPGSSFFPLSFAQIWILFQAELHRRNSKKGCSLSLL